MAPCGMTHITPKMIRNGRVSVGDRIVFEEEAVPVASSNVKTETDAVPVVMVTDSISQNEGTAPWLPGVGEITRNPNMMQQENWQNANGSGMTQPSSWQNVNGRGSMQNMQEPSMTQGVLQGNAQQNAAMGQNRTQQVDLNSLPLIFNQMTDYAQALNEGNSPGPTFTVPSSPLTPPGYSEVLDYDSVQYLNGFLRTQIGRFMRIEQLVSSDTVTDRSGFLVGVGNNYIILQEFTTGNIMVFDIYSVKFVYVYYSQPVFPQFGGTSQSL